VRSFHASRAMSEAPGAALFQSTLPRWGWLVRIIGSKHRLVYGLYRRPMKTIGYLGQIDRLFGTPATTRSWNTILSALRILKSHEPGQ
jgi:hypothetical protein